MDVALKPPLPLPGAGDPALWVGLQLATIRYERGGQASVNPAHAVPTRGADGYRVGDLFEPATSFDAAVRRARERAVQSLGAGARAAHAQAVLQAADGAYYVTALGYGGTLNWHIDGPAYADGSLTVDVERTTPALQAVVGCSSWIDFRPGASRA